MFNNPRAAKMVHVSVSKILAEFGNFFWQIFFIPVMSGRIAAHAMLFLVFDPSVKI